MSRDRQEPIDRSVGKGEAMREVARRAGLAESDAHGEAMAILRHAAGVLGAAANPQVALRDAAEIEGAATRPVFARHARLLRAPQHLSGMPACFTPSSPEAYSPDLTLLTLPGGYLCHLPDCPVIVTSDGGSVVRDYSSRYAGLVHHYDIALPTLLAGAQPVDGTVIVLADDVRPLNFCHWLIDWLPRLAVLGELAQRPDTYVAVPPLNARYQWDTLRLCGFDAARVIELSSWQALRARRLLVTSDLQDVPHPAHKAAPWTLHYLRATLGFGAMLNGLSGPQRRSRLYLSRRTGVGRRVVNEDALFLALARRGYRLVDTNGMSIEEQIATFASATHIVAAHGAGLANIVFSAQSATLVELFPRSYGTPAYYALAGGLGMTYASYIADEVIAGSRDQIDDFAVDVADFLEKAGALL